jgi:lysophospholipase L1-like esterase
MKYLALGDSYTIGEQVPAEQNFPNQLYRILNSKGIPMQAPRFIAVTGWTTDELLEGIRAADLAEPIPADHDLVSLLIGVNNQYRDRDPGNYGDEFETLLMKALQYAGGDPKKVVVLSIPDWGVTPFAEGRDRARITAAIDEFNRVGESLARKHHIYYINITAWTREAAGDATLLTGDKLHPSGKEYARWAGRVADYVLKELKPAQIDMPDIEKHEGYH